MLQKRFMITLMSVLMLLALVACSGTATTVVESSSDTVAEVVAVSEAVATAPASAAEALAETDTTQRELHCNWAAAGISMPPRN